MAEMSQAMQMATAPRAPQQPPAPPQGGLAQTAPPTAQMQQNTGQAQAIENREFTESGLEGASESANQSYAQFVQTEQRRLMERLMAGLPSSQAMARSNQMQQQAMERSMAALAPRQLSGMDLMMAGIGSYKGPIDYANTGAALAGMGQGVLQAKQGQEDREISKATAAEKLQADFLTNNEKRITDTMGKLKDAQGSGKPEFYLPDGTAVFKAGTRLVYMDKDGKAKEWLGAEKTVIGGDTLFGARARLREQLIKQYIEETKLPLETAIRRATSEADSVSDDQLRQMGVGSRPPTAAAATPSTTAAPVPTAPAIPQQPAPPTVATTAQSALTVPNGELVAGSPEGYDFLRKAIAAKSAEGDRKAVTELQAEMAKAYPQGRGSIATELTPRKDVPKAKMEEETASVTGKALGEDYKALQSASAASAEMKMQLATLSELYKTPNLPEGALAEKLQGIRSSLKSLGVDVGPEVGAGDMISAIGGKMALLTRTADGSNLMPGAMSDFEQRILRGLAPGLQQTTEGRVALVGFLNNMADIRIRLAKEANEMAAENRGILPSNWYSRRDRILKEEQAKMVMASRDLSKRFNPGALENKLDTGKK